MRIKKTWRCLSAWAVVIVFIGLIALGGLKARGEADETTKRSAKLTRLRSEGGYFYDVNGRVALLRGANVPAYAYDVFPFDERDLEVMRSFGFNFIRLGISWAKSEPSPGHYELEHIRSAVNFARQAGDYGIYVMPEVHQVGWCADKNVPQWMCENKIEKLYDPKVLVEMSRFWNDPALQDKFIEFWTVLAREFHGLDNVMGFNPMNEPTNLSGLIPGMFEKKLFPFYDRWIRAIREVDPQAIAVLEPCVVNAVVPLKTQPLPHQNLAYAPHPHFFHYYTNKKGLVIPEREGRRGLDKKYKRIAEEARELGAALIIGEFGAPEQSEWATAWLERSLELQDQHFASWAVWVYNIPYRDYWAIVDQEGKPKEFFWQHLRRPYPRFTAGRPLELFYSADERTFRYRYKPDHSVSAPTEVFLPSELARGRLEVTGGAWSYDEGSEVMLVHPLEGAEEVVIMAR